MSVDYIESYISLLELNRVCDPSVILVAEKEADFKDETATVVYNAR